jgi:hypothetical protein
MKALRAVRPSPATVIASIALLVALAGTGYAATSLPANSVGNRQLQANAVTSPKVKNHSLLRVDFAANQLPRGARGAPGLPGTPGAAGDRGPTGPSGTAATKWALVGRDGNFVAGSATYSIIQSGPGQYYVNFGSAVNGHAIVVTSASRDADNGTRGTAYATVCGAGTGTPPPDTSTCSLNNNTSTVFVTTLNPANTTAQSHAFYIAVL